MPTRATRRHQRLTIAEVWGIGVSDRHQKARCRPAPVEPRHKARELPKRQAPDAERAPCYRRPDYGSDQRQRVESGDRRGTDRARAQPRIHSTDRPCVWCPVHRQASNDRAGVTRLPVRKITRCDTAVALRRYFSRRETLLEGIWSFRPMGVGRDEHEARQRYAPARSRTQSCRSLAPRARVTGESPDASAPP